MPKSAKVSPPWVPVLMFTLLGLGGVLILLNYLALAAGRDVELVPVRRPGAHPRRHPHRHAVPLSRPLADLGLVPSA